MPLYSSDALVLRTYKLAETDRIVVFLTRDRGKRRGVAKGARRVRSPFAGGLEPLTRASVAYFEREHGGLVKLNYVEVQHSPLGGNNAEALGYVGYFAELLDEWLAEADPNETLFRLAASVVEALTSTARVDRLARYFEYWLLRLQGVYPSIVRCGRCGGSLSGGARLVTKDRDLCCGRCGPDGGGPRLSGEAMRFLADARAANPEALEAIELPAAANREIEVAHQALITMHLEKELKSIRVLRDLQR